MLWAWWTSPVRVAGVALAVLVGSSTRPALAGNASYIGVAAVTEDGSHFAVFQELDGSLGSCGLTQVPPTPSFDAPARLIVTASCLDGAGQLLPVTRWKWQRRIPQVAALRAFHRDQVSGVPVRLSMDRDTRVGKIEVFQQGRWFPVLADESGGLTEVPLELRYGSPEWTSTSNWAKITGFVRLDSGYLIRLWRAERLLYWDEVLIISDLDASNVAARLNHVRQKAAALTQQLRVRRERRSDVFIATPAGPINQIVRKRNRAAAARVGVRLWENAAAYGALSASDVRDALWLLAWIDAPTRRLEALRWYLGLRDQNANAADAILLELDKDAETAWLAAHLRSARDPLRNLPDVAGTLITDAALRGVSDEQLRWLHLAQWAAQGGYRFEDQSVHEYFAQFPWYSPIPASDWPRWKSKSFLENPDARLLMMDRAATPSGAIKESLEAVLRAERARGLSPPTL